MGSGKGISERNFSTRCIDRYTRVKDKQKAVKIAAII